MSRSVLNCRAWARFLAGLALMTLVSGAGRTSGDQAAGGARLPAQSYQGYTLVWADEFDREGTPDPANWNFEHGFVRNQELQWYQPDNARAEAGILVIEGRRERRPNPNYVAGASDWKRNRECAEYTSSSLITRGLHQWQFGRIEMRARIDIRPGMWPAFWTLGAGGAWPHNGEVDVMEYHTGAMCSRTPPGADPSAASRSGTTLARRLRRSAVRTGPAVSMSGGWSGTRI